ncbi:MAG: putative AGC family protein kinase [Streblomastix strix]|uniref:mitogen-activated protein kinase kinase n=1 Tax=Streblomastix strix TaxID=222440 RepID=A0A5J4VMH4_9EUKA|nr:MAG: putative AGC family protein kinase [Streblomastix strix]
MQLLFFQPIRPLGHGSSGRVYLSYNFRENLIVATKIIPLEKFELGEWKSVDILWKVYKSCPFILDYIRHYPQGSHIILLTEYANMKTLNIFVKQLIQPPIPLQPNIFRAFFKQILVGIKVYHAAGLVHRDIKCDNILLNNPPGSQRVYVKISDFGFSNTVDLLNAQNYFRGTLPYMAPEILEKPIVKLTQKIDIFALGITMIRLLTHKYPLNLTKTDEYRQSIRDRSTAA